MTKSNMIFSLLFCLSAIFCNACPEKQQRVETKLNQGAIAELAKKTGFASKLPQNTEIYLSYQGLDKLVRSMLGGRIGQALEEEAPDHSMKDEILEDRDYKDFMTVGAEDMFISGGKTSFQLVDFFARLGSGVMQMEMRQEFARMVARMEGNEEWWGVGLYGAPTFFKDRARAYQILKNLEITPVYAGFKVSDKEKRGEMIKIIQDGLNEPIKFQEKDKQFFTAVKSDIEGGFSGFKLNGADMVKSLKGDRGEESIVKELGQELYDDAMKEIAKREVVLMAGVVGDYIVFFAGKSEQDLSFAPSAEESMLANPEIAFARNYADKDLKGLMFFSDAAMKSIHALKSELPMLAKAYTDAMKETEYFGDTTDIQKLINVVGENSEFIFDILPKTRLGVVMYLEDGFKMDSYLGKESVVFDLDAKRNLAAMANHDGAILSGNWIFKPEFTKNCSQLLEAAGTAAYEILQLAVEQDVHDDDWLEFVTNFRSADSEFSADLLRLWVQMKLGLTGLSGEHAIMLDLKGRMPSAIPDVPKQLKENGLVPRLAYASTVVDRSRLAKSWDEIAAVVKDIGNGVGKLTKEEVSIQKPSVQKKGGLDLWTYENEATEKDLDPTLGLNDKLFFLTTSPNYIQDLAKKAAEPVATGAEFVIRIAPVREAANDWLKLFEKHGKEFLSEREWEEFQATIPMMKKFIDASKEVEKLDVYTRKVGGEIRNSIHFHTN